MLYKSMLSASSQNVIACSATNVISRVQLPYIADGLQPTVWLVMLGRQHGLATATKRVNTQRKWDVCYRPRAGRVEEEVRQARAVELIAQKRLLDLHMRSQVCASCCSMPYNAIY